MMFACAVIFIINSILLGNSGCLTIAGPGKGRPCIFPFKFQELEYSKCTTYLADDKRPWCATKVSQLYYTIGIQYIETEMKFDLRLMKMENTYQIHMEFVEKIVMDSSLEV